MKAKGGFPRGSPGLAAILAIAATYGYFLLFAEFALLELAKPLFGGERAMRPLLGLLGGAGIIGSALAAWRFRIAAFREQLMAGFVGCAVSAAITFGTDRTGLWLAAAGVGVSLGWTTVTLSSGLRVTTGSSRLGLCCGLGTGLAYAISNLPLVFSAPPRIQTMIALGFALVGAGAARLMFPRPATDPESPTSREAGLAVWGVIFLALVWLDAAGFYILQHTPKLREETWSGAWPLFGNALTHLVGAVLAGLALNARRPGATVLVAMTALGFADILINRGGSNFAAARVLYTMGVSAYSATLVFYPALRGRPWVAAGLFALAGWGGSALGIGMVQDLHAIPAWFIGLAGVAVGAALLVRWRMIATPLLLGLIALSIVPHRAWADERDSARGREVYIAEGCINCHSQYVRPNVPEDVLWWGPAQPLTKTLSERPPLVGLRRQGPDLTNVANRRTPEWQRLHLIAPRSISPGSRMPSYARLFRPGDRRGAWLVAYLAELGADTVQVRQQQVTDWKPAKDVLVAAGDEPLARRTFIRLCASCHGLEARGDGMLASQLSVKPADLGRRPLRHVQANEADRVVALSRIIKFGVPGTPMAGHEYLDDSTVVKLARYVDSRGERN